MTFPTTLTPITLRRNLTLSATDLFTDVNFYACRARNVTSHIASVLPQQDVVGTESYGLPFAARVNFIAEQIEQEIKTADLVAEPRHHLIDQNRTPSLLDVSVDDITGKGYILVRETRGADTTSRVVEIDFADGKLTTRDFTLADTGTIGVNFIGVDNGVIHGVSNLVSDTRNADRSLANRELIVRTWDLDGARTSDKDWNFLPGDSGYDTIEYLFFSQNGFDVQGNLFIHSHCNVDYRRTSPTRLTERHITIRRLPTPGTVSSVDTDEVISVQVPNVTSQGYYATMADYGASPALDFAGGWGYPMGAITQFSQNGNLLDRIIYFYPTTITESPSTIANAGLVREFGAITLGSSMTFMRNGVVIGEKGIGDFSNFAPIFRPIEAVNHNTLAKQIGFTHNSEVLTLDGSRNTIAQVPSARIATLFLKDISEDILLSSKPSFLHGALEYILLSAQSEVSGGWNCDFQVRRA